MVQVNSAHSKARVCILVLFSIVFDMFFCCCLFCVIDLSHLRRVLLNSSPTIPLRIIFAVHFKPKCNFKSKNTTKFQLMVEFELIKLIHSEVATIS